MKLFDKNPIKDPNSLKHYERLEKSRIDKKLKEILIKTGTNINTIKNIEDIIDNEKKNENKPNFKFNNEDGSYKNPLSSRFKTNEIKNENKNVKSKIFSRSISKNKSDSKIINKELITKDSEINIKIINTEIYISKNKKINFEFYSNQDPIILTEKFCLLNEVTNISEIKKNDINNQICLEIKKIN